MPWSGARSKSRALNYYNDPLRIATPQRQAYTLVLSLALASFLFLLTAHSGLGLGDEGHLWYGMIHTAQGAVPIRDFRSYDPGRYYWAAGWSLIFGPGIVVLRIANTVFRFIGLSLGLMAVSRVTTNKWVLALAGVLLAVWMFPAHKAYEHSLAIAAVFFAVFLIERRMGKRYFIVGVFTGLAAFIGRNLGLYCFVAFLSLIFVLWLKRLDRFLARRLATWTLGIAIGYLPMLLMMVTIPRFFTSWLDSVFLVFTPYAPVLPTPVPWPWTLSLTSLNSWEGIQNLALGSIFLMAPAFYLGASVYIFRQRALTSGKALLSAAVMVGIPLMHHAAVRSDAAHLAQSIHPFLIGLIAAPLALRADHSKWVVPGVTVFILIITAAVAIPNQFFPISGRVMAAISNDSSWTSYRMDGDSLWLPKEQASYIETVRQFVNQRVSPDEAILIAPYEPGLYAILGRTSPIWDPYPIFPVGERRQKQIIHSLADKNVNWALISNRPLDGMVERRFSHTHNLVWEYLMQEFTPVDLPGLPDDRLLLRRQAP